MCSDCHTYPCVLLAALVPAAAVGGCSDCLRVVPRFPSSSHAILPISSTASTDDGVLPLPFDSSVSICH
jgi:hypothetical protein